MARKRLTLALREIAGNPNYIDGIFNYCDRWCERCAFTSRCRNYALGEEMGTEGPNADPAKRDIRNKEFWDFLGELFRETFEMIADELRGRGIDPEQAMRDGERLEPHRRARREEAERHPIARASYDYAMDVKNWLDSAGGAFDLKREELLGAARMELPGTDPSRDAMTIGDAIEVVQWYQFFIHVKLMRALGRPEDEVELEDDGAEGADIDPEYRQAIFECGEYDALGSVKVALVAMDRSIAAWSALRPHFPDHADRIIDFLVTLDQLRRETEKAYPKARTFKRPGFDDPHELPAAPHQRRPGRKRQAGR